MYELDLITKQFYFCWRKHDIRLRRMNTDRLAKMYLKAISTPKLNRTPSFSNFYPHRYRKSFLFKVWWLQ